MATIEEDVQRRKDFYNKPEVTKYLCKEGVPKTKSAMSALMLAGGYSKEDSIIDSVSFKCLNGVLFAVHPQQINIRDKINGMIIASLHR